MTKHIVRFVLAFHVAAFIACISHMLAIRLFVTDFGDIEVFSEKMEEYGVIWIAIFLVTTSATIYTWALRKRPLLWAKNQ
jgi:putative flippase GtrA